MFSRLRRASPDQLTAQKLYGAVVAGARDPSFYRDCGVPDTPQGRYEMLVLHTFLMAERLRSIPGSDALERSLVEAFVSDVDDNMREMGVGDVMVHRKVKKATAGLFERSLEYRDALSADETSASAISAAKHVALVRVLVEHLPTLAERPDQTVRLASGISARAAVLRSAEDGLMTAGGVTFAPLG